MTQAIDIPNMTLFDIEVLPCFAFVTVSKFSDHHAIISGIVTGDVANLQRHHENGQTQLQSLTL